MWPAPCFCRAYDTASARPTAQTLRGLHQQPYASCSKACVYYKNAVPIPYYDIYFDAM